VIDLDEAQRDLGDGLVKTETPELDFAEKVYRHFDWVNLFGGFHQSKRLLVMGNLSKPVLVIFERDRE
jgi:hypothetical protein